jgi:hypothetical protein
MSDTTHHSHTEAYRRGDNSPEALEHEIDEERRSVSQTLEALQEKMSVGSIVDEAWRNYGHYGSDIGRTLGRTISENPLPLILTGVGLAWLMASSGRRSRRADYDEDYLWEVDEDLYEEDFVGTRQYGSASARPYGTAAVAGRYERRGPGMTDRVRGMAGSVADTVRGAVSSATHAASSLTHRAGDAGHSAYDSARGAAGAASAYAGDAASHASESARGAAGSVGGTMRHAGDMVGRGAYEARRRAADYGRYAADYGRYTRRRLDDMLDDHPLVMGALALAIGAAIGGALPKTRIEDEYMGEYSEEAWQMAQAEAGKARRVAGAVAEEARHIAEEKYGEYSGEARTLAERARHEAGDAAERLRHKAEEEARGLADRAKSEAREAADRLTETAREEARKQDLGHPGKHS